MDRIHSSDTIVLVDGEQATGCLSLSLDTPLETQDLQNFGELSVYDRLAVANQTFGVSLGWLFSPHSIDSHLVGLDNHDGFLNSGHFDLAVRNTAGEELLSGAYLTDYSVRMALGSPVEASASFECDHYTFWTGNPLAEGGATNEHNYDPYMPRRMTLASDLEDIGAWAVQEIEFAVNLSRENITMIGSKVPFNRYLALPSEMSLAFTVLDRDMTGINSFINVLNKGNFFFTLGGCDDNPDRQLNISGVAMKAPSKSLDLDGNQTTTFNYVGSLHKGSFVLT